MNNPNTSFAYLPDWLKSKGIWGFPQWEPLSIHSADWDAKILIAVVHQLGDVACRTASIVGLALMKEVNLLIVAPINGFAKYISKI